jgi:DNA (cytosine-5)-methyltransferase 1
MSRKVMKSLTSIDLFAGAGGLSSGLAAEGFEVRVAVENDPTSAKTYALNHGNAEVIVDDIRRVTASKILELAKVASGDLDLLTGCPPCQAFSTLRTRRRSQTPKIDESETLILEMFRLIQSIRPRAVLVENVPGLANSKNFLDFQNGLKNEGYHFRYAVINASKFGLPQRRKRLIFVALRDREVPVTWADYVCDPKTVRTVIANLPAAGNSGDLLHDLPENRTPKMIERIKETPKNGGSRHEVSSDLQCPCHSRTSGFRDVYGRMAWDDISPTITGGCNNPSRGRFLHPEEDRAITLREAALLQTFPREYKFCLDRGKEHVALQIGNAFPPEMIRPIARVIKQALLE